MRKFYLNLNLKFKILLPIFILILMISAILGAYSYKSSKDYALNRVRALNLALVKQIDSEILFLLNDFEDVSTYLCLDSDVKKLVSMDLSSEKNIPQEILYNNLKSLNFTKYLFGSKKYLSCINIYGKTEVPIYFSSVGGSFLPYDLSEVKKNKMYDKILDLKGLPLWFTIQEGDQFFLHKNASRKIALGRALKDSSFTKNAGLLFICIDEDAINKISLRSLQNNEEGILILDNAGNIVSKSGYDFYSPKDKNLYLKELGRSQEGDTIATISGKETLISYLTMAKTGWKIYYAYPMISLTKEINSIKYFTGFIILLCLLISLPIIYVITYSITSPIYKLLRSMKRFQEGNFEEKVSFKYKDEIGKLGEGYNDMVTNIKDLINRVYVLQINKQELQIKEREAELDALQAQINPHFLYNTLDTIYWKAFGGNENETEISEMVYSLSKIFRLSLNRGKSFTTVALEKELIDNYLKLQKMRFKDKLKYEIDIDIDILSITIPKLILQPFIENSIIHGIEGKENGGTIIIRGYMENNCICCSIEDNGLGISMEKISTLLGRDEYLNNSTSSSQGGYAISNIVERLQLIYGSKYVLDIKSTLNIGTIVKIIIPVKRSD